MLSQYPGSAQFHALKLKVEQAERQELSAYIAEVGRSVDAEPNLDRRVNILEEACRRYTQELQFQQSLRLVREQRDLVQSISTKARQYEEQSQFAEAIGQWKILRNIHPQYPGVDLEMGQLEKRREQQAQEEKKARLIDQIDHEMDNCAHAKALHLAGEALAEFPQDSELIILEKIARQNLERTQEAERLFEEARKLRSAGQLEEAAEFLRRALKFDERNPGMRNALIGLLVERANLLLEKDWRLAEPLCEAALSLDDQHPAVKRLRTLIAEAKRKDIVTECIAEARELHVSGDLPGALVRVGQGLSRYPDETRLIQYQTSLQAGMEQQEQRAQKPEPSKPPVEEQVSPRPVITPGTGFTDLYERSVVLPDSLARMTVIAPSEAGVSGELSFPRVLDVKPSRQTKLWGLGVAAAFIVGSTGVFLGVHHKRQPTTTPGAYRSMRYVEVPVTLAPADAQLVVDGTVNAERTLQLAADKKFVVSVSKIGYKPFAATGLSPNRQGWNFALAPEQMHLQVLTAEHSGRVFLDNHDIWNLQQGDMVDASLPADGVQHSLTTRNQSGELFKVIFRALPGQIPELMPVTGREFVVSGLGNEAKVFTASSGASVSTSGMPPVGITTNGTRLDLTATDPDQTLLTTSGAEKQSILFPHGNAPVLLVSLHANSNLGSASIKTNIENAKLLFDGHERKSRRPGQWHISAAAGSHELEVMAEGYTTEKRLLKIENGQDLSQTIELARASAELVVQGGTGGAEVFIDDRPVGTIDSTDSLKLPIPPGQHQIELRHAGFESLTLTHTFEAGLTFALKSSALKLFGTINFAVTPIPATVRYRRAGESNWHSGAVGSSVRVKAGKYEVLLKADGYEPSQQEFEVASGGVVEADWHLRPLPQTPTPRAVAESPKDRFQHPEELEEKPGPWLTGNSGRFLALRPAKKYTLTFLTPAAMPGRFNALTGKHRPKWNVVVRQFDGRHSLLQDAEIEYELEEHQLMRKVKVDGKVAKSKATADFADGQFAYTVDVMLQGDGIRTMTRDGKLLDQFTDNRFDWANPTVAIKGDTFFVVR